MGEAEVLVGCPHRLRQFIGRRAATPCAACAPFGPPGWPRLAIGVTIDYGPRLSRAATAGVAQVAAPPKPVAATSLRETITRAMALSIAIARPTLIERVQQTVIEHGALNVVMPDQSEADRQANVIRVTAEQAIRFRRRT